MGNSKFLVFGVALLLSAMSATTARANDAESQAAPSESAGSDCRESVELNGKIHCTDKLGFFSHAKTKVAHQEMSSTLDFDAE